MSDEAVRLLHDVGVIKQGHFLLSSGKHSDRYVEKFDLLRQPTVTARLLAGLAAILDPSGIDIVVGPTTGGILLAFELGRQLDRPTAYAERVEGGFSRREFRRGTVFAPRAQALVIDDILTTGGSIRETLQALEAYPVSVVGVAILVDRSGGSVTFGDLPIHAIATVDIAAWDSAECPQCAAGVPLVKPGTTVAV